MERPFSYAAACAFVFGAAASILLLAQLSVALRPASATDLVQLGGIEALVYVLGCFAILRGYAPERPASNAFGLRTTHPALLVFGAALGLTLHGPADTLDRIVEHFYPTSELELIQRAAMLSPTSSRAAVLVVLVATCVVPLVEELFFRGAVYGALRRTHAALGAGIVSGLCFVFSHAETRSWLPLLLVSAVLTLLRVVSGSLLPALALHVTFNAVSIAGVLTGVVSVSDPVPLAPGVVIVGWLLSVALVFAVQYWGERSPEAERARAEDADES